MKDTETEPIIMMEIKESSRGHRIVLPGNVREAVGNPKRYRLKVVEENGKRKIILEPIK